MGEQMEKLEILVADDSSTIRKLIADAITQNYPSCIVYLVEDGYEAVQYLAKKEIDIAFIDLNMPQASGLEVLGTLQIARASTFAICMSSGSSATSEKFMRQFGAYNFLKKPFGVADVCNAIESYRHIKSKKELLLVDDSATVRTVVKKVTGKSIFNLSISEAGSGEEAINLMRSTKFDILLTDFNMPIMNGLELISIATMQIPTIKSVLMTTTIEKATPEAERNGNVNFLLSKPFFAEDLDSIFHSIFDLPHPTFSKAIKPLVRS